MGCKGEVVFSGQYDPDVWDDSSLIRAYDRAMASSRRELARRKNEGSAKKRQWDIGSACRAEYEVDGEEYEGFVVASNPQNRSVTVRFLGYNNEQEVKTRDLMDSLGQEARDEQLEQAEMEEQEEEEDEEKGDNWANGDWCRAVYSEDGLVYEGVIETTTSKRATVRFLGYNNREKIPLENLFKSKGDQSRLKQENQALLDEGANQDLVDKELQDMIAKNCPDIMATFGSLPDSQVNGSLPNSDIAFPDLENADSVDEKTEKSKDKKKKDKKEKKDKKKKKDKNKSSNAPIPGMPHMSHPNPNSAFPSMPGGLPFTPNGTPSMPGGFPSMPSMPGGFPSMPSMPGDFPSMPSMPGGFPSMPPGFPPMPAASPSMPNGFPSFPAGFAPPPPPPMFQSGNEHLILNNSEALHSMLMSWYMAGFHTGQFQARSTRESRKTKKDKDHSS